MWRHPCGTRTSDMRTRRPIRTTARHGIRVPREVARPYRLTGSKGTHGSEIPPARASRRRGLGRSPTTSTSCTPRSEERRVGKECGCRWAQDEYKNKEMMCDSQRKKCKVEWVR